VLSCFRSRRFCISVAFYCPFSQPSGNQSIFVLLKHIGNSEADLIRHNQGTLDPGELRGSMGYWTSAFFETTSIDDSS